MFRVKIYKMATTQEFITIVSSLSYKSTCENITHTSSQVPCKSWQFIFALRRVKIYVNVR